jgi:hypothetical protein
MGQELARRPWKKRWLASIVAVAAASAFDAQSSIGRPELNPLLRNSRGQFSTGRAVAFKLGGVGSMVALQSIFAGRDSTIYKTSAVMNLVSAGAFSASAARNTVTAAR